jgi:hypothetical protein
MVTEKPLAWSSFANEAATIPLPKEDVTPPVTKIYLIDDIKPLLRDVNIRKNEAF